MLSYPKSMNFLKKSLLSALALGAMVVGATPAQAGCGEVSFYGLGDGFHGQRTANGERFNAYGLTAASPYLPLGSYIRVRHKGRSVMVRVTDRGPYVGGRILDLSYGAFIALANPGKGVIKACYSRA